MRMLLFLLLLAGPTMAQITLTPVDEVPLEADAFAGYDPLGFAYWIKDNTVHKSKGTVALEYRNLALGKIRRVDISNPLRVVVFYEAFNAAVLLDNQLNQTQQINFSDQPTPIVATAVATAAGNRLWVFNTLSQKIGLFDCVRNTYRELTVPFAGKLLSYEANYNYFYWLDDAHDFHASDLYGKISEYGQLTDCNRFTLTGDEWLLCDDGATIEAYNWVTHQKSTLGTGQKTIKSLHYQAQILTIFTPHGISNQKIKLP